MLSTAEAPLRWKELGPSVTKVLSVEGRLQALGRTIVANLTSDQ